MVKHSMPLAMGWSLDFRFPIMLATTTILGITIAAALASYFPARRITRGDDSRRVADGVTMEEILIRLQGVEKVFEIGASTVRAIDHLDLGILRGSS